MWQVRNDQDECGSIIGVYGSRTGATILEAASNVMDIARQTSKTVLMQNCGSYCLVKLMNIKGTNPIGVVTDKVVTDAERMGCIVYKIGGR